MIYHTRRLDSILGHTISHTLHNKNNGVLYPLFQNVDLVFLISKHPLPRMRGNQSGERHLSSFERIAQGFSLVLLIQQRALASLLTILSSVKNQGFSLCHQN